jgi:hypothetical protein
LTRPFNFYKETNMNKTNDNSATLEADRLAKKGNPARDVRRWLHQCKSGTLGTISSRKGIDGFPVGSVVPFAVDAHGRPLILIASIAAHTRNLKADNRATLFVHDPNASGDPQKSWRASLVGRFTQLVPPGARREGKELASYAESVSQAEWNQIMARYTERVPQAPGYLKTHGFSFWRLTKIETIRYIAGFGRICWVGGEDYAAEMASIAFPEMERGAMAHMNDDHEENMKEMCRSFFDVEPERVEMVSLDIGGFVLETHAPEGLHSCAFENLVEQSGDYKSQIIKLLGKARRARSG